MTQHYSFTVRNREILGAVEEDWGLHGLHDLTPEGGFAANLAHSIERTSPDTLRVFNTEGDVLTWTVQS
jgi:hypothetical protein